VSDGMNVPYPKDVREKAKAADGLLCLDINPHNGTRITYKGPASEDDLRYLSDVFKRLVKRQGDRHDRP